MNTINLLSYLIIHILIVEDVAENTSSCLFEIYSFFCVFWIDILTFTNGIGFLMLFKAIAEKRPKRVRSFVSDNNPESKPSITELADKWKRKDYGTGSLRKLLQAKSGQYSALGSVYSKYTNRS